MDNLEKEELETLKAIMNISYSLLDNLYNLTNLELNNNTDEIKKLCESIKQTLIVEKSLYEKFSSNRIEKVIQE